MQILIIYLRRAAIVLYNVFGPYEEPEVLFNEIHYVFLGILGFDSLLKILESGVMNYLGSKINS